VVAAPLALGCRRHPVPDSVPAAKSATPVDRLAPGELPPGEQALYGLVLPTGMKIQGRMADTGLAWGQLPAEEVANYVRSRVEVQRVEIGAARTVFPAARIKGGDARHVFQIEVVREDVGTRLIVRDITPKPQVPPVPGLSDAERWRRAGFSPDGKPLNMKALE
jgi:hypothetical protein